MSRSSAGRPASSRRKWRSAPGDHHGLADRPAALAHDGADELLTAGGGADGSVAVDGVVEDEGVRSGYPGGRGQSADHGDVGPDGGQLVDQAFGGEREGIGEQQQGGALGEVGRDALDGDRVAVGSCGQPERSDGAGPRRPHRQRGDVLRLRGAQASTALAADPTSRPGRQDRTDGGGDLAEELDVRRAGEDQHEVGLDAADLDDASEDLADGIGGDRVLGQGGGEGHGPRLSPDPARACRGRR